MSAGGTEYFLASALMSTLKSFSACGWLVATVALSVIRGRLPSGSDESSSSLFRLGTGAAGGGDGGGDGTGDGGGGSIGDGVVMVMIELVEIEVDVSMVCSYMCIYVCANRK